LKPKALARKIGVPESDYTQFRQVLRELVDQGRVEISKSHAVRSAQPHGTIAGTYRRTSTGVGYVRPAPLDGQPGLDVRIAEGDALDAATGDTVLVRLTRKPHRPGMNPNGTVIRI